MPLPTKRSDEDDRQFISRCNRALAEEYEDPKQRNAVCYSQLRKSKGEAEALALPMLGDIGLDIGAEEVLGALDASGGQDIELRIHSRGGDVLDGLAIYNALKAYPGKVTAFIEGVAASMAAVVAMGADRIVMPENSFLMIHNPSVGIFGGRTEELRRMGDLLGALGDSMVEIFTGRTGLKERRIRDMLDARPGYWMTAKEAVKLGFADEVGPKISVIAQLDEDFYASAPSNVRSSLEEAQAMADRKGKSAAKSETDAAPSEEPETTAQQIDTPAAEPAPSVPEAGARASAILDENGVRPVAYVETAAYALEVVQLCALAGVSPKIAERYIAEKIEPTAIRSALLDRVIGRQAPEISAAHDDDATTEPRVGSQPPNSVEAKYGKAADWSKIRS